MTPRATNPVLLLLRTRRRVLLALAFALVGVGALYASRGADRGELHESLAAVLRAEGLDLVDREVLWLGPPAGPLRFRQALLLAREGAAPPDLYFARVRAAEDGSVLGVASLSNLSRSSSAEEHPPVRLDDRVLYLTSVRGAFDAAVVLDLRGEPARLTRGWPALARLQNSITNVQDTGRVRAFGLRRYTFSEPASDVQVRVQGGRYVLDADGRRIVIAKDATKPIEGASFVEVYVPSKARPGTITWLVDTVRNLSFVGPEPIAWLEYRVFGLKDFVERAWHGLRGVEEEETEQEVAEDFGFTVEETRRKIALEVERPEIDWPPENLEPVLRGMGRVRGEGAWLPVVDDPFVVEYPNAPPAFYQTFLRVDPERLYVRVYIELWDPRQLQLRIMTGTREPESATGATGEGRVPRDPAVLGRLVGAFNGGFQATHGEFGMMSEGRIYLPPKPWAATVGVYKDGRVAMGSWLPPPKRVRDYAEDWAVAQIPDGMIEYRQNLTSVVEDGRYNPWHRWYWGAAPLHSENQTYIDRSGICLTEEGFFAYFWGQSMGPEQLGNAMLATRCVRGMHLDMNLPHTGFEFYHVRPADDPHPPLGRPLAESEFEGPVPGVPTMTARVRKAVRSMKPMRFPRYLDTDPRDFFYLVRRPVLPGPPLAAEGESDKAAFSSDGLPHGGWPYAFARAQVGEAGAWTWYVRIDGARVVPGPVHEGIGPKRVLAYLTGAAPAPGAHASYGLYAIRSERQVGRRYAVGAPPPGSTLVFAGAPPDPTTRAALGVDRDGFLLYVEQPDPGPEALPIARALERAGVGPAVALPEGVRLVFVVDEHHVGPDSYEREADPEHDVPLFAAEAPPRGEILFPDVKPRPYGVWARLQDARVRYQKPERAPRFVRPADAGVDAQ